MTTTTNKNRIDWAVAHVALNHFGIKPEKRISNFSDFERLPEDVKSLCFGNKGFKGIAAMKQHLETR